MKIHKTGNKEKPKEKQIEHKTNYKQATVACNTKKC